MNIIDKMDAKQARRDKSFENLARSMGKTPTQLQDEIDMDAEFAENVKQAELVFERMRDACAKGGGAIAITPNILGKIVRGEL